ncbi:uncharacterized protein LOC135393384 [Ornithodoros turicata]|uniref:uncharacterized protein LOC135393384 n=1 Tax=Ornithodoros turicata TaxID=34597 RepID=UPI003138E703
MENIPASNGVGMNNAQPSPASSKADPYCEKYYCLLRRYNAIQQQNYHLMYRIQRVKKLTARLNREKRFLVERLNNYKQENSTVHLPQYQMEERQYTRMIKQEPMEAATFQANVDCFSRKRKDKGGKPS